MSVPVLLDKALLDRFETRLRAERALILDAWAPGLDDGQIDALLLPLDIDLPEEARAWWRWHNGTLVDPRSRAAEISPYRELLPCTRSRSSTRSSERCCSSLSGPIAD